MKEVQLTQGYIATVDDEDFERVSEMKWRVLITGNLRYAYSSKDQLLHRFILGIDNPKVEVDHKDRCGLNCSKENLRVATKSQNNANRAKLCGDNSHKGVGWHKASSKWRATIKKNGKAKHLGLFTSEVAAKEAYNKAAKELFGEFARF